MVLSVMSVKFISKPLAFDPNFGDKTVMVQLDPKPVCSCAEFQQTKAVCRHIQFVMEQELNKVEIKQ
jgi:hypothetical protein